MNQSCKIKKYNPSSLQSQSFRVLMDTGVRNLHWSVLTDFKPLTRFLSHHCNSVCKTNPDFDRTKYKVLVYTNRPQTVVANLDLLLDPDLEFLEKIYSVKDYNLDKN